MSNICTFGYQYYLSSLSFRSLCFDDVASSYSRTNGSFLMYHKSTKTILPMVNEALELEGTDHILGLSRGQAHRPLGLCRG